MRVSAESGKARLPVRWIARAEWRVRRTVDGEGLI